MAAVLPKGYETMTPEEIERQRYLWNTDFQYGDWLMPSVPALEGAMITGSPVATLMFAYTTHLMSCICNVLGEESRRQYFNELNGKIKEAFVAEYMNEDGTLKTEYQGIYVLALAMEVVPEPMRKTVMKRLVHLIHENGDLLGTGFLSVPYLLPVLHENDEKELANRLLFQDECPSWLYEVKMGATTMWESWDAYASDGTPRDYSMNHFAFGCVGEYLFRTILGLKALEPGFSHVHIQPDLDCGLTYVKGNFDTIWGKIEIAWKRTDHHAEMDVIIPPDVKALIIFGTEHTKCYCGSWHFETELSSCETI